MPSPLVFTGSPMIANHHASPTAPERPAAVYLPDQPPGTVVSQHGDVAIAIQ